MNDRVTNFAFSAPVPVRLPDLSAGLCASNPLPGLDYDVPEDGASEQDWAQFHADVAEQKEQCAACPLVNTTCREWALDSNDGHTMWAGMTPHEIQKAAGRKRRWTVEERVEIDQARSMIRTSVLMEDARVDVAGTQFAKPAIAERYGISDRTVGRDKAQAIKARQTTRAARIAQPAGESERLIDLTVDSVEHDGLLVQQPEPATVEMHASAVEAAREMGRDRFQHGA